MQEGPEFYVRLPRNYWRTVGVAAGTSKVVLSGPCLTCELAQNFISPPAVAHTLTPATRWKRSGLQASQSRAGQRVDGALSAGQLYSSSPPTQGDSIAFSLMPSGEAASRGVQPTEIGTEIIAEIGYRNYRD
jgi:hypothetical protein